MIVQYNPRARYLTGYPVAARRRQRWLGDDQEVIDVPPPNLPPDVSFPSNPTLLNQAIAPTPPTIVFTPAQGSPPPPGTQQPQSQNWLDGKTTIGKTSISNKTILGIGSSFFLLAALGGKR